MEKTHPEGCSCGDPDCPSNEASLFREAPDAIVTNLKTKEGERVYDLEPLSGELCVIAGPEGLDPTGINQYQLPAGYRWVESEEWEYLVQRTEICTSIIERTANQSGDNAEYVYRLVEMAFDAGYKAGVDATE